MRQLLTDFLHLGLMASIMAVIVLCIRACVLRAPKIYTYILWIFVFIRAVLPISYSSPISLWTLFQKAPAQTQSAELSVPTEHTAYLPNARTDAIQNPPQNLSNTSARTLDAFEKTAPNLSAVPTILWAIGFFTMLLYSLAVLSRLRKTVRFSVLNQTYTKKYGSFIYESDQIQTAFILGFFRPSIYLPAGLSNGQKLLILEHETTHIRRHDHQIKIIAWLILSLHWFQPLLWVSFYFLEKDMELSCDEQVLSNLGTEVRTDYSFLLLKLAAQENFPAGIPLAFSRGSSKTRIKNILRYRPQKAFSAVLTTLLIGVTLYGCMGSPKENLPAAEAEAPQTEAISDEMLSNALTAPESEELAFAKKFVSAFAEASTNIIADDLYEMLSEKLKAEADAISGSFKISRLDNGHYMTGYGPFLPGEPVITEVSDNLFEYQLTPVNSNPETFRWGDTNDVWHGKLLVKRNADGALEIAEWEDITCAITSRTQCLEHLDDSTLQIIAGTIPSLDEWKTGYPDWKREYQDDDAQKAFYEAFGDPAAYLENSLLLTSGKVTDIKTDEATQDKHVTYTWNDGSVTFHMQYRKQDNIWVPFQITDNGSTQK